MFEQTKDFLRLLLPSSVPTVILDDDDLDHKLAQSQRELMHAANSTREVSESLLHEMQDVLKDTIRKFKQVGDLLPDSLIVVNEHGMIQTFNFSTIKLFGLLGCNITDTPINSLIEFEIRNTKKPVEILCTKKDGTIFPAEIMINEIDLSDYQTQYIILIRDITERKLKDDQLKKYREELEILVDERTEELEIQKEMYRTLSRVSPVGIFRSNSNGDVIYVNRKWVEITGISKPRALEFGWLDCVCEADRDRVKNEWERCNQEKVIFNMKFKICVNHVHKTILGQANFVNGGNIGMVGTFTEIDQTIVDI